MRQAKKKFAKLGALAVATVMVASIGASSFAFAAADLDKDKKYSNKYATFADALKASGEVNEQIEAEGIVLLKNKTANGAAPLAKGAKVTVLGSASINPSYGGAGSGSISRPGNNASDRTYVSESATDVYTGLGKGDALVTNSAVKAIYDAAGKKSVESGTYMQLAEDGDTTFAGKKYKSLTEGGTLASAESTYEEYNTAIIVITRSGSEFYDNAAYKVAGHSDQTDHYLELDDKEEQLMAYAKKNFNKVIVLLNGPSALEVGDLKNDDGIDAVYWVGQPGWNGFNVLGKVLTGEINPSGKLVDEWFTKFEYDPTWYNWGSYGQAELLLTGSTNRATGTNSSTTLTMGLSEDSNLTTTNQDHVMDYAEGIYLGYRYAETVYEELKKTDATAADTWYSNTIAYPFGYGLSYTSFTKEITEVTGNVNDKDGELTVKVKVTNTGTAAGKEVVQIYSSAPYTAGGIEKAACDLVGFGKTQLLAAGQNEVVEVKVAVKDLAAFDYNDANKNQHNGYELEAGAYKLTVRNDSHTVAASHDLTVTATINWDEDKDENTPNNIFSQKGNNWEMYNTLAYNWTVSGDNHYMTRGTTDEDSTNFSLTEFASAATDVMGTDADKKAAAQAEITKKLSWLFSDDNKFTDEAINSRHQQYGATNDPYHDWDNPLTVEIETDYMNPWTKTYADLPAGWTQATEVGANRTQAYELLGEPMYLEDGTENPKWTAFMNQFTYNELAIHSEQGRFLTPAQDTVGLPKTDDKDGPAQMNKGWTWTCEVVIASTWNQELAYQQGLQNGYESMLQSTNGWYGPAANNHRNPLSGRNFEYYSQDGVQGGLIAAAIIKGATELGVHVYFKHAFMNDQETQRYGMATFATEQAIRLIYAKPWELAIRKGNLNGTMSAFNNVGNSSSGSYAIMIQLYENEWGFDGYSVTDMYGGEGGSYLNMWSMAQLARGHNTPLGSVLNGSNPNKDAGVWSKLANGGKGGVMVKSSASATTEDRESPTQWYWVRTTAMHQMYTQLNSNSMKNGFVAAKSLANATLTAKVGITELTDYKLVNLDYLNGVFGGADKYTVTVSNLPAGLTYNQATGTVSGTATAAASRNVTVAVAGKEGMSWISGTATVTTNIKQAYTVSFVYNNKTIYTYDVAYTIAEDGTKTYGSVDFTTDIDVSKFEKPGAGEWTVKSYTARVGNKNQQVTSLTNVSADTNVTVAWNFPDVTVIDGELWLYGTNTHITTVDTSEYDQLGNYIGSLNKDVAELEETIENLKATIAELEKTIDEVSKQEGPAGKDGANGKDGVNGKDGKDGKDGVDGKDGGGCGSAITMGSILPIAGAFALVCAAIVVKKLSKKEN